MSASPRALEVLRCMRAHAGEQGGWNSNSDVELELHLPKGAGARAMNELHALSLVEPGRRSMWRLSALGRAPGATFTSPL